MDAGHILSERAKMKNTEACLHGFPFSPVKLSLFYTSNNSILLCSVICIRPRETWVQNHHSATKASGFSTLVMVMPLL